MVKLVRKDKDGLMRTIGFFSKNFMSNYWTTYRLPFCQPVISYPTTVENPEKYSVFLVHENAHVEQFRPWYGPFIVLFLYVLLPLPVMFSGRWFVERGPYLLDIKAGFRTPESAAATLWAGYFYPWPRSWMAKWFHDHLTK
jgi:hypothetical protein